MCGAYGYYKLSEKEVYKFETSGRFKPETEGSIIVPTEDCYIQGFLLKKHFAFQMHSD